MKKVLLIGLILAICILAFPQGVLAADLASHDATVSAIITPVSDFTATGYSGVWSLSRGDNTYPSPAVTLVVDSNIAYDISATPTGDGHMTAGEDSYTNSVWLGSIDLAGEAPIPVIINGALGTGVTTEYTLGQKIEDYDSANAEHSITITFDMTSH